MREAGSGLGYVADAFVPEALVLALTGLDEGGLSRFLEQAARRSVLRWEREPPGIVIHALTAGVIAATNAQKAFDEVFSRGQTRLRDIDLVEPATLREEIVHHRALHERAADAYRWEDPRLQQSATALASAMTTLGRYEDANALHEETVRELQQVHGPEHPVTLSARYNLGVSYTILGRHDEALELDEEVLRISGDCSRLP